MKIPAINHPDCLGSVFVQRGSDPATPGEPPYEISQTWHILRHPQWGYLLFDHDGTTRKPGSPRLRGCQLVADDDVASETLRGLQKAGYPVIARP